jgi:hypothetical protein
MRNRRSSLPAQTNGIHTAALYHGLNCFDLIFKQFNSARGKESFLFRSLRIACTSSIGACPAVYASPNAFCEWDSFTGDPKVNAIMKKGIVSLSFQ